MQVYDAVLTHETHQTVSKTFKTNTPFLLCFSFCLALFSVVVRYWHRSLNPRKLVEVKFSHLSRNMTLQRTMKLYRLPDVNSKPASFALFIPIHINGRNLFPLFPLALFTPFRALRPQVCGRWRGVTSARSLNCFRNFCDVSSLHLLWEKRRWLTGSSHRTTSSMLL